MAAAVPLLSCRKVGKSFGALTAVNNLSFDVGAGEILGIGGPNGAGKTTLFEVISGLNPATTGEIRLAGEDITRLAPEAICHAGIARTFQLNAGFDSLTARENVELPLALNDVPQDELLRRSRALLEELGIASCADRFPEDISGGEQQRVAVARAVEHEPQLVLADEPTGNLDEHTADIVFAEFLRLVRDEGSAALVATHNERIAAKMDRVLRLHEGHIEA